MCEKSACLQHFSRQPSFTVRGRPPRCFPFFSRTERKIQPMPRKGGNSKLDTRSAGARLARRREPYWSKLQGGLALGYRRTDGPNGSWIARHYEPGKSKQYH